MQMAAERKPVEGFTATLEKGREQVALGGDSILLDGAMTLCLKVVIEDGGLTFWGSGPERV